MTLSKREKQIVIGVGAAVALLILNQIVIDPYFTSLNQLSQQVDDATKLQSDNLATLARKSRLSKDWDVIRKSGLTDDVSDASEQAQNSVLEWARSAGVNLTDRKPERMVDAGPFQVISFHIIGSASTPQLRRFLMSFETTKLPVRIVDLQVAPAKEGTDDLTIQMSISTLCLKQDLDTAGNASASAASRIEADKTWN